MIEESAAFLPIWMLLSAAFGFMIGEAYGDQARHRKCLEQANADLRNQLQNAQPCTPTLQCELDQQRHVTRSNRSILLMPPSAHSLSSSESRKCFCCQPHPPPRTAGFY